MLEQALRDKTELWDTGNNHGQQEPHMKGSREILMSPMQVWIADLDLAEPHHGAHVQTQLFHG